MIHVVRSLLRTEQSLSWLAEAPQRISELTADLTPAQLRTRPDPDEWSANDVLAHLRSCADTWGKTILRMIEEDRPTVRAMAPDRWLKQTNYRELEFEPSFRAFVHQRAELLAALEALPPEGWLRTGTLTGAGRPLPRIVNLEASELARHDRQHVKQIAQIVKSLTGSK
jgi:hypothetical protein